MEVGNLLLIEGIDVNHFGEFCKKTPERFNFLEKDAFEIFKKYVKHVGLYEVLDVFGESLIGLTKIDRRGVEGRISSGDYIAGNIVLHPSWEEMEALGNRNKTFVKFCEGKNIVYRFHYNMMKNIHPPFDYFLEKTEQ